MPVKKAANKKRKKVTAPRKKVVRKKSAAKKKASKKRPASRRKVAKKVARKKSSAKKKKVRRKKPSARKKAAGKKKPAARKKAVSKKAASKKKPAARKKAVSKKKTVTKAKPAARKRVARNNAKPATRSTRSRRNALSGPIHGIAPYKPGRGEDYMSDEQLEHFREILKGWKNELMFEVDRTVHHMQDEAANFPDPNDRATQESEFGLELRTRDRERKLLRKIDSALGRVEDGSYGFCDETGEAIGLKRLEARPVATLSLEAQERREMAGRQYRDRDDRYR